MQQETYGTSAQLQQFKKHNACNELQEGVLRGRLKEAEAFERSEKNDKVSIGDILSALENECDEFFEDAGDIEKLTNMKEERDDMKREQHEVNQEQKKATTKREETIDGTIRNDNQVVFDTTSHICGKFVILDPEEGNIIQEFTWCLGVWPSESIINHDTFYIPSGSEFRKFYLCAMLATPDAQGAKHFIGHVYRKLGPRENWQFVHFEFEYDEKLKGIWAVAV